MKTYIKFLLFVFPVALLVLGISSFQRGVSSQTATEQNVPPPTERNSFIEADAEPRPQGRWSVVSGPDERPLRNNSYPVVVSGVLNIMGRGPRWGGFLKMTAVGIDNRTSMPVSKVRIAWFISHVQDRIAPNKDTILLEGETPLFDASVPANTNIRNIEIPIIHFFRIARPLMMDGTFNGDFAIMFRVSEVEFGNGSVWTEEQTGARLNLRAPIPLSPANLCIANKCARNFQKHF